VAASPTPGTWEPASPAGVDAMVIACVAYDASGQRIGDIALDAISEVLARPDAFVWVGMHEPDITLLDMMQCEFGLHDLAIEDARNAHQRPKIEVYGDSLFVVINTAEEGGDCRIAFGETHAFLGHNYLLTVRHGASSPYGVVRQRCEREPELLALGPSYALYAILDSVVDHFMPIVESFRRTLTTLEAEIFAERFKRDTIERLYRLKKELATIRLAIAPMQDILSQLIRLHPTLVRDEVRLYFRDVYDHAVRVNESSETMSELVSAAINVNLAIVTVAQGHVVKRLAAWAWLIAVPTLIASWYGMNFAHMPELPERYGYAAVVAVTVAACAALFVVLRRSKWL
jgi:magnesium transporter